MEFIFLYVTLWGVFVSQNRVKKILSGGASEKTFGGIGVILTTAYIMLPSQIFLLEITQTLSVGNSLTLRTNQTYGV